MIRTGRLLVFIALGLAPSRDALAEPEDGCVVDTDVVGYRQCPRYGVWGAALESPYVSVHVGLTLRHLPRADTPSRALAARSVTEEPLQPQASADTSLGFVERVTVAIARRVYLGFEAEFGDLDLRESDPGTQHLVAGGVGLGGLQGGIGIGVLGVEVAGGGHVFDTDGEIGGSRVTGVLEVRGRLDLWLGPWVTIGGTLGTSLIEQGNWMAGVSFGVHSQSFGGYR